MNHTCVICKKDIRVMCFKGTGFCGTLHEKEYHRIRTENLEAYEREMENKSVQHSGSS